MYVRGIFSVSRGPAYRSCWVTSHLTHTLYGTQPLMPVYVSSAFRLMLIDFERTNQHRFTGGSSPALSITLLAGILNKGRVDKRHDVDSKTITSTRPTCAYGVLRMSGIGCQNATGVPGELPRKPTSLVVPKAFCKQPHLQSDHRT